MNLVLKIRQSTGLSQQEFADRIYVSRQSVSRWEKIMDPQV